MSRQSPYEGQKSAAAMRAVNEGFTGKDTAQVRPSGLCDRLSHELSLAEDVLVRIDNIAARLYGAGPGPIGELVKSGERTPDPALTLCDRLGGVLEQINERLLVIQQSL